MRIIFLDIDGVMTSKNGYLKEGRAFAGSMDLEFHQDAVEALNHILDATDARIVVSSTYRWMYSVKQLKEQFEKNGIDYKYVISKTPDEVEGAWNRGEEIKYWLENYPQIAKDKFGVDLKVDSYVILDDDVDFLVSQRPNFVKTFKDYGLTFVEAEKAINILSGVKEKEVIIRRQVDAHGKLRLVK